MKGLNLLLLLCATLALSQPAALPDAVDGVESHEALPDAEDGAESHEALPDAEDGAESHEALPDAEDGAETHEALPEDTREDPDTEEFFPEDDEEEPGNWTDEEGPTFEPVDEEAYLKALNGTAQRSGSCSTGWTRVKGRCYHVFPYGATWHRAQANCRSIQAHLASIQDYEVNNQLLAMIRAAGRGHTPVWIGGNDIRWNGRWTWVDGRTWNYSNWCRWEPNNFFGQDCLQINYSRHRCWDDAQCYFQRPFICVRNF